MDATTDINKKEEKPNESSLNDPVSEHSSSIPFATDEISSSLNNSAHSFSNDKASSSPSVSSSSAAPDSPSSTASPKKNLPVLRALLERSSCSEQSASLPNTSMCSGEKGAMLVSTKKEMASRNPFHLGLPIGDSIPSTSESVEVKTTSEDTKEEKPNLPKRITKRRPQAKANEPEDNSNSFEDEGISSDSESCNPVTFREVSSSDTSVTSNNCAPAVISPPPPPEEANMEMINISPDAAEARRRRLSPQELLEISKRQKTHGGRDEEKNVGKQFAKETIRKEDDDIINIVDDSSSENSNEAKMKIETRYESNLESSDSTSTDTGTSTSTSSSDTL